MNKQEFRIKAHQKVEELIAEYEKLDQKKDTLSANLRNKYNQQMESLRKKRSELEDNLKKIEENDKWEEKKEIFNKSLEHYKNGFSELGKLFKS